MIARACSRTVTRSVSTVPVALTNPLFALGASVLYFDLRRIKDGNGAAEPFASPVVAPPDVPGATPHDH